MVLCHLLRPIHNFCWCHFKTIYYYYSLLIESLEYLLMKVFLCIELAVCSFPIPDNCYEWLREYVTAPEAFYKCFSFKVSTPGGDVSLTVLRFPYRRFEHPIIFTLCGPDSRQNALIWSSASVSLCVRCFSMLGWALIRHPFVSYIWNNIPPLYLFIYLSLTFYISAPLHQTIQSFA